MHLLIVQLQGSEEMKSCFSVGKANLFGYSLLCLSSGCITKHLKISIEFNLENIVTLRKRN